MRIDLRASFDAGETRRFVITASKEEEGFVIRRTRRNGSIIALPLVINERRLLTWLTSAGAGEAREVQTATGTWTTVADEAEARAVYRGLRVLDEILFLLVYHYEQEEDAIHGGTVELTRAQVATAVVAATSGGFTHVPPGRTTIRNQASARWVQVCALPDASLRNSILRQAFEGDRFANY
jgi:hypothetical protein